MIFNSNQAFVRNNQIETASMGEELGMLNVETGMYFILDSIASDIWQALEKPMTINHLVMHLMKIYEVGQETCYVETEMFLNELIANKLVEIVQPHI